MKKQKSRKYKRYIRKQIKKAFSEEENYFLKQVGRVLESALKRCWNDHRRIS